MVVFVWYSGRGKTDAACRQTKLDGYGQVIVLIGRGEFPAEAANSLEEAGPRGLSH